MNAFGRCRVASRSLCAGRRRCCGGDPAGLAARVGDAPNPAADIVGDIQRSIRPDGEARRPVRRSTRLLDRAGKSVGEDN